MINLTPKEIYEIIDSVFKENEHLELRGVWLLCDVYPEELITKGWKQNQTQVNIFLRANGKSIDPLKITPIDEVDFRMTLGKIVKNETNFSR